MATRVLMPHNHHLLHMDQVSATQDSSAGMWDSNLEHISPVTLETLGGFINFFLTWGEA